MCMWFPILLQQTNGLKATTNQYYLHISWSGYHIYHNDHLKYEKNHIQCTLLHVHAVIHECMKWYWHRRSTSRNVDIKHQRLCNFDNGKAPRGLFFSCPSSALQVWRVCACWIPVCCWNDLNDLNCGIAVAVRWACSSLSVCDIRVCMSPTGCSNSDFSSVISGKRHQDTSQTAVNLTLIVKSVKI